MNITDHHTFQLYIIFNTAAVGAAIILSLFLLLQSYDIQDSNIDLHDNQVRLQSNQEILKDNQLKLLENINLTNINVELNQRQLSHDINNTNHYAHEYKVLSHILDELKILNAKHPQ